MAKAPELDKAHDEAIKAAAALARKWAGERRADGDPEGADTIDDLADAILRLARGVRP